MKAVAAILAVAAAAGGCATRPVLTEWMWRQDPEQSAVVDSEWTCAVAAARGRLAVPPGERELALDVTLQAAAQALPARVAAYSRAAGAESAQATLALRPTSSRRRWPEDYVDAERVAVGLRVSDASYFRDGELRADVVVTGSVAPPAVGRLDPDGNVPRLTLAERRDWAAARLPVSLLPLINAFAMHPWGELLQLGGVGQALRCDPVAWRIGDRRLGHEEMAELVGAAVRPDAAPDPDAGELLVRFVLPAGEVRYAAVPVPLLREGGNLLLWREGGRVRWTRREIWRGELRRDAGPSVALPALDVPLASTTVRYGWAQEYERSRLLADVVRTLLTPVTVAIDVVAATNPVTAALVRMIVGEDERFVPAGGRR